MNDHEYELIGESIWNTYQSMAYILMGEAKSPQEHGESAWERTFNSLRGKALTPDLITHIADMSGEQAARLRRKRLAVATALRSTQKPDYEYPHTSSTRAGARARKRGVPDTPLTSQERKNRFLK